MKKVQDLYRSIIVEIRRPKFVDVGSKNVKFEIQFSKADLYVHLNNVTHRLLKSNCTRHGCCNVRRNN